jgi:hypothetical protein
MKEPYAKLRKKVLAYHKEMGMEDAFRYSPKDDEYFETADYEDRSPHTRFIRDYDEKSFWAELASKLATRDLDQELKGRTGTLNQGGTAERYFRLMTRYEEELAENGLDHLQLNLPTPRLH